MIQLASKLGVRSLGIRKTIPSGRSLKNWKSLYITPCHYKMILKEAFALGRKHKLYIASGDPLSLIVDDVRLDKVIRFYDIKHTYCGCIPGISYIFITNQAKVVPCGLLQDVILGDLRHQSLKEIWDTSDFLKAIRTREKLTGKCAGCKYKFLCGGCRAAALHLKGELWGEDPSCWLSKAECS